MKSTNTTAFLALVFLFGGCRFNPEFPDGKLRCGTSAECPENFCCASDGLCYRDCAGRQNGGPDTGSQKDGGGDGGEGDAGCRPGEEFCDGNEIYICKEDGTSRKVGECDKDKEVCINGMCAAKACEPGSVVCESGAEVVVTCNRAGTAIEARDPCGDGEYCDNSVDKASCRPWGCTPGEKKCYDDGFRVCDSRGSGFGDVTACQQGEKCQSGDCVPNSCSAGDKLCIGNEVHRCNADGTGFELDTACTAGQYCENAACKNQVCSPNARRCDGDYVKQCDGQGKAERFVQTCAAPTPRCEPVSKSCVACLSGADCTSDLRCNTATFSCYDPCAAKECGTFEGKDCGACGAGNTCVNGTCQSQGTSCPADKYCGGRVCGPDPICGVSCGTCPTSQSCVQGACQSTGPTCPDGKDCTGRECGPDPVCGVSCGTCAASKVCVTGKCQASGPTCPNDKDCTGRACGPDPVCGVSCGTCVATQSCDANGLCVSSSKTPTAVAYIDQTTVKHSDIKLGDTVVLDGTHSTGLDKNGNPAEIPIYEWTITGRPAGSSVSVESAGTNFSKAKITPDKPGLYTIELSVTDSDGNPSPAPDVVTVYAGVFVEIELKYAHDNTQRELRDVDLNFYNPAAPTPPTAPDRCTQPPNLDSKTYAVQKCPTWGDNGQGDIRQTVDSTNGIEKITYVVTHKADQYQMPFPLRLFYRSDRAGSLDYSDAPSTTVVKVDGKAVATCCQLAMQFHDYKNLREIVIGSQWWEMGALVNNGAATFRFEAATDSGNDMNRNGPLCNYNETSPGGPACR